MTAKTSNLDIAERRAMLLAELLFQDLGAQFIAQPDSDSLPFDLLIGFLNANGGTNTFAVKIHIRERPVTGPFSLTQSDSRAVANSNLPVLLLVVDAKHNQLWYGWGADVAAQLQHSKASPVSLKLREVTDQEKKSLQVTLTQAARVAS